MIPTLYLSDETDFGHNGFGYLNGLLKNEVVEVLNGEFELSLDYPLTGRLANIIAEQMLIKAKPNRYDDPHLFRIYEITRTTEGSKLEIKARSATFDLAFNMVKYVVVEDKTVQEALNLLKNNAIEPCNFLLTSDMTRKSSTVWERRNLLNCISGEEGSILQYWGGEITRGNGRLSINERRGQDRGVSIRHGRNLKGLTANCSTNGMVTAIVPYCKLGQDQYGVENTLDGNIVYSDLADSYPHTMFQSVEFPIDTYGIDVTYQNESDETVTERYMDLEILNNAAQRWFEDHPDADKPSINISVQLEDLSQTKDYEKFENLERVQLGDTVHVYSEKYNVNIRSRVISIKYDGLRDKNTEVEIGQVKATRYDEIRKVVSNIVSPIETTLVNVQTAANDKNRIFSGPNEPTCGMSKNDIWYKPVGSGETELYRYDGTIWRLEKVSGSGTFAGNVYIDDGEYLRMYYAGSWYRVAVYSTVDNQSNPILALHLVSEESTSPPEPTEPG